MLSLLSFDGLRPIWSAELIESLRSRHAAGRTLSPPDYPHSAEDLAVALRRWAPGLSQMRDVAVWSSLTPWVETLLLAHGAASVTTVDFNEPVLPPPGAGGTRLQTLPTSALPAEYARGRRFDLILFFSGVEHDGLGRYGDPINPHGDYAAMAELRALLRPESGLLLLATPLGARDDVHFPWHLIYGPRRLPRLLRGFDWLGNVWDGQLTERGSPGLPLPRNISQAEVRAIGRRGTKWIRRTKPEAMPSQYQPVLALRAAAGASAQAAD